MRKRLVSILIGIAVLGVVAVSLAGGETGTVPVEPVDAAGDDACCCGGAVEDCAGDCDACDVETGCEGDSCACDTCCCETDTVCGCGTHDDDACSEVSPHRGCGGCH